MQVEINMIKLDMLGFGRFGPTSPLISAGMAHGMYGAMAGVPNTTILVMISVKIT